MENERDTTPAATEADLLVFSEPTPSSSSSLSMPSTTSQSPEDIGTMVNGARVFTSAELSKLKKGNLKELCKERKLFDHKGSKMKVDKLIELLVNWGNTQRQLQFIEDCEKEDETTLDNPVAAGNLLVSKLRVIGVCLDSNDTQARMQVGPSLLATKLLSTNKFCINKAGIDHLRKTKAHLFEPKELQETLTSRSSAPKSAMTANEFVRLIHCVFAPENDAQLIQIAESSTREQLDAAG
ncbi:MAG: hypothetical protein ACREOZ_04415, partial [Gloeomargaritales cyanobacterium]